MLRKCPFGLHWNRDSHTCDWPDRAGCQKNSEAVVVSVPPTPAPVTETKPKPKPNPPPQAEVLPVAPTRPPSTDEPCVTGKLAFVQDILASSIEAACGKNKNGKISNIQGNYLIYQEHSMMAQRVTNTTCVPMASRESRCAVQVFTGIMSGSSVIGQRIQDVKYKAVPKTVGIIHINAHQYKIAFLISNTILNFPF